MSFEQGNVLKTKTPATVFKKNCNIDTMLFHEADFDGHDWQGMKLPRIQFVECSLVGSLFNNAELSSSGFQECNLESAKMFKIRGGLCSFFQVKSN